MIEQLPALVEQQVKAIQNLKIDKITVWDSGASQMESKDGGTTRSATAGFLSGLIGSLPQIHELAEQAGVDLPSALGKVKGSAEVDPEPTDES